MYINYTSTVILKTFKKLNLVQKIESQKISQNVQTKIFNISEAYSVALLSLKIIVCNMFF